MNWVNPGDLRACGSTRTDVVDSADIAAVEADTRALAEHDGVGRVSRREREEERWYSGIVL